MGGGGGGVRYVYSLSTAIYFVAGISVLSIFYADLRTQVREGGTVKLVMSEALKDKGPERYKFLSMVVLAISLFFRGIWFLERYLNSDSSVERTLFGRLAIGLLYASVSLAIWSWIMSLKALRGWSDKFMQNCSYVLVCINLFFTVAFMGCAGEADTGDDTKERAIDRWDNLIAGSFFIISAAVMLIVSRSMMNAIHKYIAICCRVFSRRSSRLTGRFRAGTISFPQHPERRHQRIAALSRLPKRPASSLPRPWRSCSQAL